MRTIRFIISLSRPVLIAKKSSLHLSFRIIQVNEDFSPTLSTEYSSQGFSAIRSLQTRSEIPKIALREIGTTCRVPNAARVRTPGYARVGIQEAIGFFTGHFSAPHLEPARFPAAGAGAPGLLAQTASPAAKESEKRNSVRNRQPEQARIQRNAMDFSSGQFSGSMVPLVRRSCGQDNSGTVGP